MATTNMARLHSLMGGGFWSRSLRGCARRILGGEQGQRHRASQQHNGDYEHPRKQFRPTIFHPVQGSHNDAVRATQGTVRQ